MNYNIKRHQLLSLLSHQKTLSELSDVDFSDNPNSFEIQLSCVNILEKLKINSYELNILIKELIENKEIDYYYWIDEDKRGLFATSKGISSFANKNYLKIKKKNKTYNIKDIVQILIPVLSLMATILVIYINYVKTEKLENHIIQLEKQLKAE